MFFSFLCIEYKRDAHQELFPTVNHSKLVFALAGARWRSEMGVREGCLGGDSSVDRGWGGRSLGWHGLAKISGTPTKSGQNHHFSKQRPHLILGEGLMKLFISLDYN